MIRTVLIVVALVSFLLAALEVPTPRVSLVPLGLFCWALAGVL